MPEGYMLPTQTTDTRSKSEAIAEASTSAPTYTDKETTMSDTVHHYHDGGCGCNNGCNNGCGNGIEAMLAMGAIWNQGRCGWGGYGGDCGGGYNHGNHGGCGCGCSPCCCTSTVREGFDGNRALEITDQIHSASRAVTQDVNAMAILLHDSERSQSTQNLINSNSAYIQRDLLENRHELSGIKDNIFCLSKEVCREAGNLRDGQVDIERDIWKADMHNSDRTYSLLKEIDDADRRNADRTCSINKNVDMMDRHQTDINYAQSRDMGALAGHINDHLCCMEKEQIKSTAALSAQMSNQYCELKTEGYLNTQKVLDKLCCDRNHDQELRILELKNEVSNRCQTDKFLAALAASKATTLTVNPTPAA